MPHKCRWIAALICAAIAAAPAHAAKTDVVQLVNGNSVTGEIKSLEFGALRYSTDSMGTVNIDWEDIVAVESKQDLQVELSSGDRYFGTLAVSSNDFFITVVTPSARHDFPTRDVVRITPIDTSKRFLERVDGSLSVGFTTQKSSEVTTFNLATDIRYRTTAYALGLSANTQLTDQPERENSKRANMSLNYQHFNANRWFTDVYSTWERNDELGILSRLSLGGGIGRYFVQTNKHQFSVTAGLQATREQFTGEEQNDGLAEGRIQLRYLHRSLEPESSLRLTTALFPVLEDLSAFRTETDLTFRRELIDDLTFDVSLYQSYQSQPPEGAANSDYGVTTSLGYSF